MVWDDHQNRCIGELSFRSEVKAVRLRRDRVVVALNNRVYVYNFADLTLVDHLETADNPRGLLAVCPAPTNNVLACPGPLKGQVRVELYEVRQRRTIAAHEAPLACIALNASGSRLATASEKGTLIRVWDTLSGDLLQELRRGADSANICCISFNTSTTLLACASDKGTVHIFKLSQPVADGNTVIEGGGTTAALVAGSSGGVGSARSGESGQGGGGVSSGVGVISGAVAVSPPLVTVSASTGTGGGGAESEQGSTTSGSLGIFRGVQKMLPKYFSSEWSFAQFRVPPLLSICAFGAEPNTILGEFHLFVPPLLLNPWTWDMPALALIFNPHALLTNFATRAFSCLCRRIFP